MKKIVKLTEKDLNRIVGKIIQEQTSSESGISKDHPINNPLYTKFDNEINGDGVSIKKSLPNQLVINGLSGVWTLSWSPMV
jgi:hypothetical protein